MTSCNQILLSTCILLSHAYKSAQLISTKALFAVLSFAQQCCLSAKNDQGLALTLPLDSDADMVLDSLLGCADQQRLTQNLQQTKSKAFAVQVGHVTTCKTLLGYPGVRNGDAALQSKG